MKPDINLIPEKVQQEFSSIKVEGMIRWVEFMHIRSQYLPYDIRWWVPEFRGVTRIQCFRNCMKYFIKLVESG